MKIASLVLFTYATTSWAIPDNITTDLARQGKLGVPEKQCREMEEKVGQLMYITVDGYGTHQAVNPAYNDLVKRIQPGGVLPHFQAHDLAGLQSATDKLKAASKLPLMIGVDYEKVFVKDPNKATQLGLGYYDGLVGSLATNSPACYEKVGYLEGLLHRAIGLNQALGPTIEFHPNGQINGSDKIDRIRALLKGLKESAVETTLKHFPYTPEDYSLETQSKNSTVPLAEINKSYMPIYKEFAHDSGFAMSTHLLNTNVDSNNMATFSKQWIKKLREDAGFDGILMTDALFMISRYRDAMNSLTRTWGDSKNIKFRNDVSIFAAKAILAGHDMVFVESASKQTADIYADLVSLSCQNSSTGKRLRERVLQSYDKIKAYKDANRETLTAPNKLPPSLVEKIVAARSSNNVCSVDIDSIRRAVGDLEKLPALCHNFHSTLESQAKSLLNLKELVQNMSPNELLEAILSNDPDLSEEVLGYLNKNPNLKKDMVDKAAKLFSNGNQKDRLNALQTFKALDSWPASIIESAVANKNPKALAQIMEQAKYSDLPELDSSFEDVVRAGNVLQKIDRNEFVSQNFHHKNVDKKLADDDRVVVFKQAVDAGFADQRTDTLYAAYFTKRKIEQIGIDKFMSLPITVQKKITYLCQTGVMCEDSEIPASRMNSLLTQIAKSTGFMEMSEVRVTRPTGISKDSPQDVVKAMLATNWSRWSESEKAQVLDSLKGLSASSITDTRGFGLLQRASFGKTPEQLDDYLAYIKSNVSKFTQDERIMAQYNLTNLINTSYAPNPGSVRYKITGDQLKAATELMDMPLPPENGGGSTYFIQAAATWAKQDPTP